MLKKWYFFSFVFSLICLGLVEQYHNPKANQELVIQFSDLNKSKIDTEKSVNQISEVLANIGINTISIVSINKGLYQISYYSDESVNYIKDILAERISTSFENTSIIDNEPSEKNYDFDVFKIEDGNTKPWDFDGQRVYTLNLKSDRSFNPDVFKFSVLIESTKSDIDFKATNNVSKYVAYISDNTLHNIPEVRAGPLC